MSPNPGLINTPNLNFCLSSSKTQVQQFKKDVSNSATKDSNMNAQVVTHHYKKFSNSQYLLQMQVQAQQRYSNALTTKMIPYSHTMVQHFKALKSYTTLTLTKMNTCMTSPIGLPLFSNQHSLQLTQDYKGLFKACNGAECQGMVI